MDHEGNSMKLRFQQVSLATIETELNSVKAGEKMKQIHWLKHLKILCLALVQSQRPANTDFQTKVDHLLFQFYMGETQLNKDQ